MNGFDRFGVAVRQLTRAALVTVVAVVDAARFLTGRPS